MCIGQKQRWFLLRMLADEARLRFDATPDPEFDSGRWVDYWSPVREVIYFKRAVYVRALQELGDRAFAEGAPPRPDSLTDDMLRSQQPRSPRRRRRQGRGAERGPPGEAAPEAAATIAVAPQDSEQ